MCKNSNINFKDMRLIIEPDYAKVSEWAANYVASRINEANPTAEKPLFWDALQAALHSECTST